MSEHRFTVIISVDDWPEDDLAKGRAAAGYAAAALNCASLPDARQLDGFADLWRVQADIVFVEDEAGLEDGWCCQACKTVAQTHGDMYPAGKDDEARA